MIFDALLGALLALFFATLCTPVGVSGAVFLVPAQVTVLGTASPAVTPTNLLYNLIAVPGALLRFHRERRLVNPLTALLAAGTLPGVIAGAVIRVEWLADPRAFDAVIAAVLAPLGLWLALSRPRGETGDRELAPLWRRRVGLLAFCVGIVGGIYGIGGGSILGPVLVALGLSVARVAPAALASTFLTSLAGVAAYAALALGGEEGVAPDWGVGVALGIGGLAGSYLGARLQGRLPELTLRRGLGLLALALGVRYGVLAAG